MRRSLFALAAGVAVAASAEARAQFYSLPDGSLAIPNGNGTSTIIRPSRLAPGAGQVVPGSVQSTPHGTVYLGADGRVHGNLIDGAGNLTLIDAAERSNPANFRPSPRGWANAPRAAQAGPRGAIRNSWPGVVPRTQPGTVIRRRR